LGPFSGGLNTNSDPSAIGDTELVDCVNLELDQDNSLFSRPPIQTTSDLTASWTERIVILGVGVFSTGNYIIGSNTNGVYSLLSGGAWTLITSTFQATCMVQYGNFVWLIAEPGSANPGGKWDPTGGFVAAANMPKGGAAVVFKERLFVAPGKDATTDMSRLIFSEPANFEDYNPLAADQASPGVNFIDVSNGDGQKLIDLCVYRGNLLLFKEDSTYVLAYETSPADAVVEIINPVVGVGLPRCVIQFENTVYIFHENSVYEIVNYDFSKINIKCPFTYDGGVPSGTARQETIFLSRIGDRIVVRYFNRIYVYGLRTKTWSRWESSSEDLHNFGPWVPYPSNVAENANNAYYAGSSILQNEKVYIIRDGHDSTVNETASGDEFTIDCFIQTKNYDISVSHLFKRLYWWGADILSNNSVTGTVQPITFAFQTTWGDLVNQGVTWGELNTWGQPTTSILATSTVVPTGSGVQRRFIKFPRALRYRQINFRLDLTTNGTTTDGPARIYTLSISTRVKQLVPKALN
jgi:hypothetical protein